MNNEQAMKKTLLVGIAALFLATGTAHADFQLECDQQGGNDRLEINVLLSTSQVEVTNGRNDTFAGIITRIINEGPVYMLWFKFSPEKERIIALHNVARSWGYEYIYSSTGKSPNENITYFCNNKR
jgi:hypothetical protein